MSRMSETVVKRTLANSGLAVLVGLGVVACGEQGPEFVAPTDSSSASSSVSPSGATGAPSVSPTGSSTAVVSPQTSGTSVTPVSPVSPMMSVSPSTSSVSPVTTTSVGPSSTGVGPVAPASTGVESSAPNTSDTGGETSQVPMGDCEIVPTATISEKISTVGIVEFTTTANVASAKIEFQPAAGGTTITAPVDLEAPAYRTLLLGMKPDTMYTYKVIVNDSCVSAEQSLATASIPLTVNVPDFNIKPGMSAGYYIVSVYGGGDQNVIIDGDGDIVWYGPTPRETGGFGGGGSSRAKLDYESKYMWSLTANPACCTGSGGLNRVSMDGSEVSSTFNEVDKRHHDIAALPGGIMTFMVHSGQCSAVVERSPDGTVKTVVADVSATLYPKGRECHPNSIHYHSEDDSYTMSDREASLYVKFKRTGELVWQLGGTAPKGPIFAGAGTWSINHGHHMFMQDGKLHFLLFNNGDFGGNSVVREFELDEGSMMATPVWQYDEDLDASVMGDAQRLPNGNSLVAYTERGIIREVNAASATVGEFGIAGGQVGYVDYRPTLYGTPTKATLDYTFE